MEKKKAVLVKPDKVFMTIETCQEAMAVVKAGDKLPASIMYAVDCLIDLIANGVLAQLRITNLPRLPRRESE